MKKETQTALSVLTDLIEKYGTSVTTWENFAMLLSEKGVATSEIRRPLIRRAKEAAATRLIALLATPPKELRWDGPDSMETTISKSHVWTSTDKRYRVIRRRLKFTGEIEYFVEYRRMTQGADGQPIWDLILEAEGRNGYYPKIFPNQNAAFAAAAVLAGQAKPIALPKKEKAEPAQEKQKPRPVSTDIRPGRDEFGAKAGSNQAKIHAALSRTFQNMKELTDKAGLPGKTFYSHLTKLADQGLIERSKEGFRRRP